MLEFLTDFKPPLPTHLPQSYEIQSYEMDEHLSEWVQLSKIHCATL